MAENSLVKGVSGLKSSIQNRNNCTNVRLPESSGYNNESSRPRLIKRWIALSTGQIMDNPIGFVNTYRLDSKLSGG